MLTATLVCLNGVNFVNLAQGQGYYGAWNGQTKRHRESESSLDPSQPLRFYKPESFQVQSQGTDAAPLREDTGSRPASALGENEAREAGWLPPPSPPDLGGVASPPFRAPSQSRTLIPVSPEESSFTDLDSEIKAAELSESRGFSTDDRISQADSASLDGQKRHFDVASTSFEEPVAQTFKSSTQENAASQSGLQTEPMVERVCQLVARYQPGSTNSNTVPDFRPLRLLEMIKQPIARDLRSPMVSQYWDTWSKWAELNSRSQFATWINSISSSPDNSEAQLLSASKSFAENQTLEAKAELIHSQTKLQEFIPTQVHAAGELPRPPLPVDQPLIHRYVTNYQLYRNYGSLPARFQNIDAELSNTLDLIVKHGDTVEIAKGSADSQLDAYRGGRGNLSALLEAGRIWRMAEHDLITAVARYNKMIADYSLNVTDGTQAPETVVAMLIGNSASKRVPGKVDSDLQLARTQENAKGSNGIPIQNNGSRLESGRSPGNAAIQQPSSSGFEQRFSPQPPFKAESQRSAGPSNLDPKAAFGNTAPTLKPLTQPSIETQIQQPPIVQHQNRFSDQPADRSVDFGNRGSNLDSPAKAFEAKGSSAKLGDSPSTANFGDQSKSTTGFSQNPSGSEQSDFRQQAPVDRNQVPGQEFRGISEGTAGENFRPSAGQPGPSIPSASKFFSPNDKRDAEAERANPPQGDMPLSGEDSPKKTNDQNEFQTDVNERPILPPNNDASQFTPFKGE